MIPAGSSGAKHMRHGNFLARLALAACLLVTLAAAGARADECDDAIAKIKQRIAGLRATRKAEDSRPTICARLGRTSAYTQAIGIIAAECLEEGAERNALIKDA